MLRLATLGTYVVTEHDDRDLVVDRGEIDIVHDQSLVVSEARLSVDIGLPRDFAASLVLPIRAIRSRIRYLDAAGAEVMLERDGIHHRDETVSGLGDPMLLGAYARALGSVRVVGRAGLTLPLGQTEDNPFTAEAEVMPHQHVQLGSGTLDPVAAVEVSWARAAWRLGGFVFTRQSVYENSRGYQAGDRYAAGISLARAVGKTWNLRGGVETQLESAERWNDIVHTDDGNRGRVDVMLAAGATWRATEALSVEASLKLPFVTYAVGGQLDMPAILELGVAYSFGARGKPPESHEDEDDHDHGHDHGDEHDHGDDHGDEHADEHGDYGTADVVDLAPKGAAVPLVPVAGKLTIVDFWAPWCGPCKTLDPALVELAKQHPHVAVRKLDVVDWDSAAAATYLTPGGFDLPHVKIFDAKGQLVFEQTPKPDALPAFIDEIRKLVEASAPPAK